MDKVTESTCLHLDPVYSWIRQPILTYGSDVSVIVEEGAFLDMAGHETGLRFGPLPTKMCVLVHTDSALHNADADPDEEGAMNGWRGQSRRVSVSLPSMMRWSVWWLRTI